MSYQVFTCCVQDVNEVKVNCYFGRMTIGGLRVCFFGQRGGQTLENRRESVRNMLCCSGNHVVSFVVYSYVIFSLRI